MGRNNGDFQAQVLFHGSPHPFSIGDVVEPRNYRGIPTAFAAPYESTAKVFAKRPGGHVVAVEPVDQEEELLRRPIKGFPNQTEILSSKGYKVTKVVGHYSPDGKSYHKNSQAGCRSKLCNP
jgi:hypothetical protein